MCEGFAEDLCFLLFQFLYSLGHAFELVLEVRLVLFKPLKLLFSG
jgi:hypothetical protein